MNKFHFKLYFGVLFIGLLVAFLAWGVISHNQNRKLTTGSNLPTPSVLQQAASQAPKATSTPGLANPAPRTKLFSPLDKALERVTKKPFGIKVSPQNSPVNPERFAGYHTGVDFETFPDEQDADVLVSIICEGSILEKRFASGYGGVVVQSCRLDNQDITVIYGHLNLASISVKLGEKLSAGSRLGLLGRGFSTETDGERKHLHLGIHKGSSIILAGYVKTAPELSNWLDIREYLK